MPRYGLLRGACHRARVRATRWLAMTGRKTSSPCAPSLRQKEKILPAGQRSISVGLLPSRGRFHHVVANQAEQLVDLDIGRRDALGERDRKRAVAAFTVERGLSVLGCIDHQRRA